MLKEKKLEPIILYCIDSGELNFFSLYVSLFSLMKNSEKKDFLIKILYTNKEKFLEKNKNIRKLFKFFNFENFSFIYSNINLNKQRKSIYSKFFNKNKDSIDKTDYSVLNFLLNFKEKRKFLYLHVDTIFINDINIYFSSKDSAVNILVKKDYPNSAVFKNWKKTNTNDNDLSKVIDLNKYYTSGFIYINFNKFIWNIFLMKEVLKSKKIKSYMHTLQDILSIYLFKAKISVPMEHFMIGQGGTNIKSKNEYKKRSKYYFIVHFDHKFKEWIFTEDLLLKNKLKKIIELKKHSFYKECFNYFLEMTYTLNLDIKYNFNSKNILTYGTFDLFHIGHERILKRAYKKGDKLFVGVSSDRWNEIKEKKAFQKENIRLNKIKELPYVEWAFLEDHNNHTEQWKTDVIKYKINKIVMGGDHKGKLDKWLDKIPDIEYEYLSRTPFVSSTKKRKSKLKKKKQ